MPLDDVSNSQSLRHHLLVSELEELLESRVATLKDEVGTGVDVISIPDGLAKYFDVVGRYSIGVGEDLGDSFRDGDLNITVSILVDVQGGRDGPDQSQGSDRER